jgi:hypothetical protein
MGDLFTLPGIYLLEALTAYAPNAAALLGISHPSDSIILLIALSTFAWVLVVIACSGIVILARNAYRVSEAMIRTLGYRAMQSARNLRTWTICRYKSLLPKQTASSLESIAEVQFDDLDFTVLRAAAERGPGFCTSAAELAGKYSLLPSQFQKTLDKLSSNKMLTTVIGSTDGFDNYRITDYGVAYLQMWEKRRAS